MFGKHLEPHEAKRGTKLYEQVGHFRQVGPLKIISEFQFFSFFVKQCIDSIKGVDEEIVQIENKHKVSTHDEMIARDRLNFGLAEVVYEWARNKVSFVELSKSQHNQHLSKSYSHLLR